MDVQPWITQFRKGLLEYLILLFLNGREAYGYEILLELARDGNIVISEGTLYPLLARLTADRHLSVRVVNSTSGPPRRYYRLTSSGQNRLGQMKRFWTEMVHRVTKIEEGQVHE
jgi:PadR family transcriptional regulator, regulatory protein PadR